MIALQPTSMVAQSIEKFDWQDKVTEELVKALSERRGALLRGTTGSGKMYMTAAALRQLSLEGKLQSPAGSFNPLPILWLCPKSVKQQTMRVLRDYGIAHLAMVLSYGQIKNKDGTDMFITYHTKLQNGQPTIYAVWNSVMLPAIVVCDESHKLKNKDSLISRVVRALPQEVKVLCTTATPIQRVADGQYMLTCFTAVTKYNSVAATEETAPRILRDIANPKSPEEYSPSATERFRTAMDNYIVEVKNVRFKHPTRTVCSTISFLTTEERQQYEDAYNEYLRILREKRKDFQGHGRMAILVAMRKFQQKAELLRCPQIAQRVVNALNNGRCVIVGSNYKDTLRSVWTHLTKVHKIDPNRIAYIVGGQNEQERQKMIDEFQAGTRDIMLLTMTSGGVGISLHHDRETTKPRHIILPPTWSAIDLVQALGRGHRLTSKSATTQEILWYADTVEAYKVKPIVERKVKCLSKAITAKEQFMSIFEHSLEDDIDPELNEDYNQIEAEDTLQKMERGEDEADESFTGEGLDSDDNIVLPTTY